MLILQITFFVVAYAVNPYRSSSSLIGLPPTHDSKTITTYASVENLMMDITLQGGPSQVNMHTPNKRVSHMPSKRVPHTPHIDYRGMYWSEMQLNQNNNSSYATPPRQTNYFSNNLDNRHSYGGYTLGGDCGLETSFGLDGGEPRTTKRLLSIVDSGVAVDHGYSSSSQTSANVSPPMTHQKGDDNNNASTSHTHTPCNSTTYVSLMALQSCYGTDEPFSTEYSGSIKNGLPTTSQGSKALSLDDVHSVAPTPENQLLKMARVYNWANSVTKETTGARQIQDPGKRFSFNMKNH